MLPGCEPQEPHSLLVGMQVGPPLRKTVPVLLQSQTCTRHKIQQTLLGIDPEELETEVQNLHTDVYRSFS